MKIKHRIFKIIKMPKILYALFGLFFLEQNDSSSVKLPSEESGKQ